MEQVFSRTGQLSEVNLDPHTLSDIVSIMVNKLVYKPSVKDIMDKYYEMFRGITPDHLSHPIGIRPSQILYTALGNPPSPLPLVHPRTEHK